MHQALSQFRFPLFLFILLTCFAAEGAPAKKKKPAKKTPAATKVVPSPAPSPVPRRVVVAQEPRLARYRVNSLLGLNIVQGSGFLIGTQFGFKLKGRHAVYLGPEVNFTLLSGGHLLSALATGWIEIPFPSSSNLSLHLGILAGIGFPEKVPQLPANTFVTYFDAAIAQEVDGLVTIRGQIRPGMVANRFAFMMNFNVGFRLY